MAMAGRGWGVAVLLGLCMMSSVVVAFEKEVKPNNYPNFEFHESPVQETAQVTPHSYDGNNFGQYSTESSTEQDHAGASREYKPNNYPDFKFTETTPGYGSNDLNAHDQFAQGHRHRYNTVPVVSDRFASKQQQESATYNAHGGDAFAASQQGSGSFKTTSTAGESYYSMDVPVYRGSDASNKYPSSYDLINARNHANQGDRFQESAFSSHYAPFSSHKTEYNQAPVVQSEGFNSGSSRFWSPSSDPDFAFRFAKPETPAAEDNADSAVFSQFTFDNSDATNDPRATYGTTTPSLAAKKHVPASTAGHGCANMYWAEHTKQWPSFFNINTEVAQAFGTKAGDIYGTTTLLQALYDNRADGYSQLLSHGTAALMNSYAMPNYALRHDFVLDQFLGALSSRTTASVQAQKFLNANHAYGPNECLT